MNKAFACGVCGSVAVVYPEHLSEDAPVTCRRCQTVICTLGEFGVWPVATWGGVMGSLSHSFRSLLTTITRNTMAITNARDATFVIYPRSTAA